MSHHQPTPTRQQRYQGAMIGLACGDALGAPVEFKRRDAFPLVTDMLGGGKHGIEAGQWTDDTSMAMCLAESLIACQGFNEASVMQQWLPWLEQGHWSSKPRAFGIGNTILQALWHYKRTGDITQSARPRTAGNGALMRLAPIPIFFANYEAQGISVSIASSRLTHADSEVLRASELFTYALYRCFEGCDKESLLPLNAQVQDSEDIKRIFNRDYQHMNRSQVRSSGYVIDSLEAALWAFYHGEDVRSSLILAVNLGEDTDTVAAICGQLCGAYYGVQGIPVEWVKQLHRIDDIQLLTQQLIDAQLS